MIRRINKDDSGAEAVEFAVVAPVLLLIVFGLIYVLLWAAAEISLGHAVTEGVRLASLPSTATGAYPSAAAVAARIDDSTPFFSQSGATPDCAIVVTGVASSNSPVRVTADCDFPNPAGTAARALGNVFPGTNRPAQPSTIDVSATAERNRE
ncbi:MAG: TadE/TadG family type IV pilus assembly protein [Actinomycetota bacterium]